MLPSAPNPFGETFVSNPWQAQPGDVVSLQKTAFERWKQLADQVRCTGTTTSFVIYGEAGSGKTHLLARFRQWLGVTDQPHVLVWAKQATVKSLWRELRQCLFRDLFRPRSPETTELDRVLDNQFPEWRAGANREGVSKFLFGRTPLPQALGKLLNDLSQTCLLDRATRTVLPRLYDPGSADLARDWLLGEELEPEALSALGLPAKNLTDVEREEQSKQVVKTICRIAGRKTVLCICFDQIEGLQTGTSDTASLYEFAKVVFDLVEEPHAAILAVTLIQPHVLQAIESTAHKAYTDRLKQHVANIPSLGWEQTVAVALGRLECEPVVRQERQHQGDRYWPLGEAFLRKLFDENAFSLTPRHLIRACGDEFKRLQNGVAGPGEGGKCADPGPGPGTPDKPRLPRPDDEIFNGWVYARKNFLGKPQSIQFDRVVELGLPWLAGLLDPDLIPVKDVSPILGDVNVLFQPSAGSRGAVGISCCNQEPRSLWRRLDRLLHQWSQAKGKALGLLVIVRAALPPPTEAAKARIDALRKAGVRVLEIADRPLAELAAFQNMFTSAHNGKLLRAGKTVDVTEYTTWAESHLSDAVKELFRQVFDLATPPSPASESAPGLPLPAPATKTTAKKPAAPAAKTKK